MPAVQAFHFPCQGLGGIKFPNPPPAAKSARRGFRPGMTQLRYVIDQKSLSGYLNAELSQRFARLTGNQQH
jgi:hypothetical protein